MKRTVSYAERDGLNCNDADETFLTIFNTTNQSTGHISTDSDSSHMRRGRCNQGTCRAVHLSTVQCPPSDIRTNTGPAACSESAEDSNYIAAYCIEDSYIAVADIDCIVGSCIAAAEDSYCIAGNYIEARCRKTAAAGSGLRNSAKVPMHTRTSTGSTFGNTVPEWSNTPHNRPRQRWK